MTGAWGEPEATGEGAGENPPSSIDLGNGMTLKINPEQWQKLLHHPAAVEGITQRAQAMCDAANRMARENTPQGRDSHGHFAAKPDLYEVTVANIPGHTRARAKVRPIGIAGRIDDATNSTLFKVLQEFPSDPIGEGLSAGDAEAATTDMSESE